jgi:DNA invertase Pin-like site-specific DNA recombinase
VTYPPPHSYRFQRLSEDQYDAIHKALAAGVRHADLAREYGVSVRTIYRVGARARNPVIRTVVGPWTTRYAITDVGPVQIEPWRPR